MEKVDEVEILMVVVSIVPRMPKEITRPRTRTSGAAFIERLHRAIQSASDSIRKHRQQNLMDAKQNMPRLHRMKKLLLMSRTVTKSGIMDSAR